MTCLNCAPLCCTAAVWSGERGGKLAVLGSAAMFEDKWLDVEDNAKIMDWLFRWLKPVSAVKQGSKLQQGQAANQ